MGQAKKRGTPEQRKETALAAARSLFPATVKCNNCQTELADIQPLDTRGMEGLNLAGMAYCAACDHTTWVMDGDPEHMAAFKEVIEEEAGPGVVTSGFAKKLTST